jgi:protein gp37
MQGSIIAWTNNTFNPWIGCVEVSAECDHCYAKTLVTNRMGKHLWGPKQETERRVTTDSYWRQPYSWMRAAEKAGERQRVFCGSLCDWAEDHPTALATIPRLWQVIRDTEPWLDWLLLTKRALNIRKRLPSDWGKGYDNVWLGTSIGMKQYAWRRDELVKVPAAVHFISAEPLLEDITDALDMNGLQWVIIGGESGPGWRPMEHQWARNLVAKCREFDVAPFFKQSAAPRTEMGIELDGQIVREYPRTPYTLRSRPAAAATLFA